MIFNSEVARQLSENRWLEAISSMVLTLQRVNASLKTCSCSPKNRPPLKSVCLSVHQLAVRAIEVASCIPDQERKSMCSHVFLLDGEAVPCMTAIEAGHEGWCAEFALLAIPAILYNIAFAYHMHGIATGRISCLQQALLMYDQALSIVGGSDAAFVSGESTFLAPRNDDETLPPLFAEHVFKSSIAANKAHIYSLLWAGTADFHAAAA
jgi:hypothetical protein